MSSHLYSVRGMNDLLPAQTRLWDFVMSMVAKMCEDFGYNRIEFPILAPKSLFCRAIGDITDIVEKEMYSFVDSYSGEELALRPEGTACCLRAVAEHNMTYGRPQRLWYCGPMFRHERPQKGRYRQFYQIGMECFGVSHEYAELEILILSNALWRCLGICDLLTLHINTLGDMEERDGYRKVLIDYFSSHSNLLDEESRRRLHKNPFRILDTKNPEMQDLISNVPSFFQMLASSTQDKYHEFLSSLTEMGISYFWNQRLVRGLDYYSGIVFEWVTDRLGSQSAVCAGGRYDGLAEQLGYKRINAVGCAIGVERIMELCSEFVVPGCPELLYCVHGVKEAFYKMHNLARELRCMGWSVVVHPGRDSLGAQIKRADQLGCVVVLIVGQSELDDGMVCVRFLDVGRQNRINFENLPQFLLNSLRKQIL